MSAKARPPCARAQRPEAVRTKRKRAIPRTWQQRLLSALRRRPVLVAAACDAGVDPATVRRNRRSDPAFDASCRAALRVGFARAEAEGWRRGLDGWLRPVFQGGTKVGSVREYDSKLLMFMLQANLKRYRSRVDLSVEIRDRAKLLAEKSGLSEAELVATAERIASGTETP
jgi:hypothetical protein